MSHATKMRVPADILEEMELSNDSLASDLLGVGTGLQAWAEEDNHVTVAYENFDGDPTLVGLRNPYEYSFFVTTEAGFTYKVQVEPWVV